MNYKNKITKLATGIILVAIAVIGSFAGVSAASVGDFTINLSNGEITSVGANFTGYVEFTPVNNFNISSFKTVTASEDSNVILSASNKTDELFIYYNQFGYMPKAVTSLSGQPAFSDFASLSEESTQKPSLTGGVTYKIVPFTISVNPAIINETVNLIFTMDSRGCYVVDYDTDSTHKLGIGVIGIPYMLNNSTANSIVPDKGISVNIETNNSIFDSNISVFSELAKKIANSSDIYYLNYTSSNEDVIKFYNYTGIDAPKYVVLKGRNSSEITVNLTNMSDGRILDSKQFTVTTKKITLGADAFNYTNETYSYTGKSVATSVIANVTASLLNHSVGAANSGEPAATYGYVRDVGTITLKFFNDSACQNEVVPIEGGKYYFNVSIADNDNYYAVTDLQIANNYFVIGGVPIKGESIYNLSNYNAETPARMTIVFNGTGQDLGTAVFNETTIVDRFTYSFASIQLRYNRTSSASTNYTRVGTDCNISDDNTTITFNPNTHPDEEVTYFVFEGFPRGDANLDGEVNGADSSKLAKAYKGDISLTPEELFYANVKGSGSLTLNDIRLIEMYNAGCVDADYVDT